MVPDAAKVLGNRPEGSPERLGTGLVSLLDGPRTFLARPRRPKIGLGASFWRPGRVPIASRGVTETAAGAHTRPKSVFHRFGIDFGRLFIDFSLDFVRFSLDEAEREASLKRSLPRSANNPHLVYIYI